MSWLFEDPTPIVAGALLIEVLLGVALARTGQAKILAAMAGALAVALLLLLAQWLIETRSEQVDRTLHAIAERLVADDIEGALEFVAADFPRRDQVRGALAQFRVTKVKLAGQETTFLGDGKHALATAKFFAHVRGAPRHGGGGEEALVRRFTVDLRQHDGRWVVSKYQDQEVIK